MNYNVFRAIERLAPGQQTVIVGQNLEEIKYLKDDLYKPTKPEILAEVEKIEREDELELANKEAKRKALLDRLGITAEEAELLLS